MSDVVNLDPPPRRSRRTRDGPTTHEKTFMVIVVAFTIISFAVNCLHHEDVGRKGNSGMDHHPGIIMGRNSRRKKLVSVNRAPDKNKADKASIARINSKAKPEATMLKVSEKAAGDHSLGELKCSAYGGPDDEIAAKEMMYWSDIPSDAEYVSPFKRSNEAKGGSVQYMTFEPGKFL